MAKMSKAAARKRLAEATTKIMNVSMCYPEAISLSQVDVIVKRMMHATKKLK